MNISSINNYSFYNKPNNVIQRSDAYSTKSSGIVSFKEKLDDYFEPEENFFESEDEFIYEDPQQYEVDIAETIPERIKNTLVDFYNKNKTRLWLSVPQPNKRNLKAFWNDPKAYIFEIGRPYTGEVTNKEVIGEVDLKHRKKKETTKAKIRKVEFADKTTVYTIQKGKERLGYIDVNFDQYGIANINYACTIAGREDYRNLLMILLQAMIEDCINKFNYIPEIQATPAQIGDLTFDRTSLYKYYGAETKNFVFLYPNGEEEEENICYITPENIFKKLEKIQQSPKRSFIMPSTESLMEELKAMYDEDY